MRKRGPCVPALRSTDLSAPTHPAHTLFLLYGSRRLQFARVHRERIHHRTDEWERPCVVTWQRWLSKFRKSHFFLWHFDDLPIKFHCPLSSILPPINWFFFFFQDLICLLYASYIIEIRSYLIYWIINIRDGKSHQVIKFISLSVQKGSRVE